MSEEKKNEALLDAVWSGDVGDVRRLLDDGARVDQRVNDGCKRTTLLHVAAERGHVSVMELLLEKGGDFNASDRYGDTPLHRAAYNGNKAAGQTPLHIAAEQGYTEVIACIVERGGDVNAKNNYGDTPLHRAAYNGKKAAVQCLLDQKCNVDTRNSRGSTPLHIAAEEGYTEVIACIAERGGDVNAKDNKGDTPLHIAAWEGYTEVIARIVERGGDVNAKNNYGDTPLFDAAHNGKKAAMLCLLDQKCNVDTRNSRGSTPLHIAVKEGYTEVIACIAERGGDVNSTNEDGDTPLHLAVLKHRTVDVTLLQRYGAEVTLHPSITLHDAVLSDCVQLFKLLVEAGADVNATFCWLEETLLLRAVRLGYLDIVEELIRSGCDVNAADQQGNTPLHVAAQHGRHGLIKTLIGRGCDVNAADQKGNTPLHFAAQHGRHGLIKTLVDAGGNVNSPGEHDRTPLHVAVCKRKRTCVSALLGLNADTECVDGDGKTARDLSPTKAITKLLSDQSTGGCNVAIPTNEQPFVNRKRRHEESIESPSSKTRQLCHPTVSNVPASSDQPTTVQLLHLQSGAVEEGVFNPRTRDNNLENAPEAAQIQTSPDLSNTYFKRPYITSITPVGVNTSTVTSPSQSMMSLLNNTSDEHGPSSSDDINTSSVTSPSTPQMSGEHGSSVVRDEIHPTTSYEQAEASHLVNTLQLSAKSQQSRHGNSTYITTTASSIQKPEDTSDTSNLGSMAHSFATHKPTTLTTEKVHVSSSIDLQDDDNNNVCDSLERSSDMQLINSQGKAALMDGIQFPPDQIPTHSGQMTTNQVPTHSGQMTQDQIPTHSWQMTPNQVPTHSRQITPNQVPTHSGQMTPNQVPTHSWQMTQDQIPTHSWQMTPNQVPTHSGQMTQDQIPTHPWQMTQDQIPTHSGQMTPNQVPTHSWQLAQDLNQMQTQPTSDTYRVRPPLTILSLQPDSSQHSCQSTQLSEQIRQLAERVRQLEEVAFLRTAPEPPSNKSQVGQPHDANQIPQSSSRSTPADSPTPEAPVVPPLYERPDIPNHYKPTRGHRIDQCLYKILPAGQSAPHGYKPLAEGSAWNVVVPSKWMDKIRVACMDKPSSYKLKKMIDGLYEPKELCNKKASSDLYNTDLGNAIRSYAIDVLKMTSSQVTDVLNSKITTVKRLCKRHPELLQ